MTFRQQFTRLTTALPLLIAALVVAGWGAYIAAQQTTTRWETGTDVEVMQIRDHAEGSPAALLDAHAGDCWTGTQQPKAPLPGSALVQNPSGVTVRTHSPRLVDAAFREALAAAGVGPSYDNPSVTVIALCR